MLINGNSLDSILHQVYTMLLRDGNHVEGPTKGPNLETIGATLVLDDPRARLSRSYARGRAFSAIGELAWYLSGSNQESFIRHYLGKSAYADMDVDGILRGAYGPRLVGLGADDQIRRVIETLKRKPTSRQALIQILDRQDLALNIGDLPCTCVLQFFVRDNKLETVTFMRSNDAYLGLPHDVFCFTMIQELIARSLGLEPGTYTHMVGSLHLYDRHKKDAQDYLGEGLHAPRPMPEMPDEDQWQSVRSFLETEERIRTGTLGVAEIAAFEPSYWADLTRMVLVSALTRSDVEMLGSVRAALSDTYFEPYISDREARHNDESRVGGLM